MGKYKKPGKINAVSFIVFICLAGAAYAAVQFTPAYYRKWKAKGILSECGAKLYPRRNNLDTPAGMDFIQEVEDKAAAELQALGIKDTGLYVKITVSGKSVTSSAVYQEVINHPFVGKRTILRFNPTNQGSLEETDL